MQNSVFLSYTPIMGFGYVIFGSYDITKISAMASLAIDCLLVSRSGGSIDLQRTGAINEKRKT
jgi:hypothetical protein